MTQSYKNEKEAFVSGLSGSSIGHVNLISLNALVSEIGWIIFLLTWDLASRSLLLYSKLYEDACRKSLSYSNS